MPSITRLPPAAGPQYGAGQGRWGTSLLYAGVALVSFNAHVWVADWIGDLPPGSHDEFSYVFQAKTFLAGHLYLPSHAEMPDLFDQFHVLNNGKFASRYFPGTGIWLAPFVAVGRPYWGQWLAGMLVSVLILATAREIAGDLAGLVAGLLTAASPAMALFGNRLLSHHPTLLGLALFLFGVSRAMPAGRAQFAWIAGIGLAFAILCRPLTAASVALPILAVLAVSRFARRSHSIRRAAEIDGAGAGTATAAPPMARLVVAFATPVAAVLAGLLYYDYSLTGSAFKTPWAQYNELYAPSHRYGFGNALRGGPAPAQLAYEEYDRWAANLTLAGAVRNTWRRLWASALWTTGPFCAILSTVLVVVAGRRIRLAGVALLAGIAGLHGAYFGYWFVGDCDLHYVFESTPLWALLAGLATQHVVRKGGRVQPRALAAWLAHCGISAAIVHMPVSGPSTFWDALSRVRLARKRHSDFRRFIANARILKPALILIEEPPVNVHTDYVDNDPDLENDPLFARYNAANHNTSAIQRCFPGRSLYIFHGAEHRLESVTSTLPPSRGASAQ